MAEGSARAMGLEASSAGTHPKEAIHPLAIAVIVEKGIDISHQHPKALDLEFAKTVDSVVTVCDNADAECAHLPLPVPKEHWDLPNSAKAEGDEGVHSPLPARSEMSWSGGCGNYSSEAILPPGGELL